MLKDKEIAGMAEFFLGWSSNEDMCFTILKYLTSPMSMFMFVSSSEISNKIPVYIYLATVLSLYTVYQAVYFVFFTGWR